MKYARVYTDANGETHFADVAVEFSSVDYAPPAPPLNVSTPFAATQVFLLHLPPGWQGAAHASPQQQFGVTISGRLEIGVSDGEVRTFGPGSTILFEDTAGKGHSTRNSDDGDFLMAMAFVGE